MYGAGRMRCAQLRNIGPLPIRYSVNRYSNWNSLHYEHQGYHRTPSYVQWRRTCTGCTRPPDTVLRDSSAEYNCKDSLTDLLTYSNKVRGCYILIWYSMYQVSYICGGGHNVLRPSVRLLTLISRDAIPLYLVEEFQWNVTQIFIMWARTAEKVFKVKRSKVKVICVQMCECYNYGDNYIRTARRRGSLVFNDSSITRLTSLIVDLWTN